MPSKSLDYWPLDRLKPPETWGVFFNLMLGLDMLIQSF